jgi:hypothetical protein
MRIVWRRGKANINRLLGNAPPETRTAHGTACRLPYELMEMIITHIAHDLAALKVFSLTCHSWYIAAVPHLHHTLTLREKTPTIVHGELRPLSQLHQLGLMPLVKEIRVVQWLDKWFTPQGVSLCDLRYFSAFESVQTLEFQCLDISLFIPCVEHHFGHFSSTLRSITLFRPLCTPQQLSYFLSLFPNLDNIEIWQTYQYPPNATIHDTELVPFSTPRLRGRLVLHGCGWAETWTRLIAAGGGLRFHYMKLRKVRGCAPVLFEACAETLETLRFYAPEASVGE